MNPLILLFNSNLLLKPLFYLDMGVRRDYLLFISQAGIADPVSVYTVYRDISKRNLYMISF